MGLFSRRKKNKINPFAMPVMRMQTDFHSHILPGIDDGAPTVEESINMLRSFINQGYTRVITTPHIHSQRYFNTPETIEKAYDILKEEMVKQNIEIDIEVAAEYFADNELIKLLKSDQALLSLSDFNYVLLEFSFQMPPISTDKVFQLLQDKGYNAILAHPERYEYWNGNIGLFQRLKDQGFLFQGNLLAAGGYYGPNVQRNFEMLADNKMYEFLGSDAHATEAVDLISTTMELPSVQKVMFNGIRNQSL